MSGQQDRHDAASLAETLVALDLISDDDESLLAELTSRAFALAMPERLTRRERRLLELAHDVTQSPRAAAAFQHATRSYLALAASAWAANEGVWTPSRDAALLAAIVIAAPCNPNVRRAMGVDLKLADLAEDDTLDECARGQALRIAAEEEVGARDLRDALDPALRSLESRFSGALSRRGL
jgi:hypothetical protein